MLGVFRQGYRYVRENDFQTIWTALSRRDVHPVLQFAKYGMCGGLATVTHLLVFYVLAYTLVPAFEGMLVDGSPITDAQRAWNAQVANSIAFVFSNGAAYLSNVVWVFQRGRHHPWLEFGLFTAVSLLAFSVASICGPLLIRLYGIPTHLAQVFFIISSALVNFASRKFLIFKH